jgi:hypothetical protein
VRINAWSKSSSQLYNFDLQCEESRKTASEKRSIQAARREVTEEEFIKNEFDDSGVDGEEKLTSRSPLMPNCIRLSSFFPFVVSRPTCT